MKWGNISADSSSIFPDVILSKHVSRPKNKQFSPYLSVKNV